MIKDAYTPLYISEGSGLTIPQTMLLRENSRGISCLANFIHRVKDDYFQNWIALGWRTNQFETIIQQLGLKSASAVYYDILPSQAKKLERSTNTPEFMSALHRRGEPTVFFVPDDCVNYPFEKSITTQELWWCLDNPTKIAQIEFVFGLNRLHPMDIARLIVKPGDDVSILTKLFWSS